MCSVQHLLSTLPGLASQVLLFVVLAGGNALADSPYAHWAVFVPLYVLLVTFPTQFSAVKAVRRFQDFGSG